ncbi:hypothetical protein P154DRAFT_330038 [Amniculicola lignicola CBS 123094]|uniref:Uncharacterized protein n=1 Tax=Amniculicola lignicola CBS 123094 TaxID=1392246 RepID=A0A6A5W439_9PLEO|nr:hypothetical protein P154DRAFT_330038 [Amniculicola lignicola CBS 123094]
MCSYSTITLPTESMEMENTSIAYTITNIGDSSRNPFPRTSHRLHYVCRIVRVPPGVKSTEPRCMRARVAATFGLMRLQIVLIWLGFGFGFRACAIDYPLEILLSWVRGTPKCVVLIRVPY